MLRIRALRAVAGILLTALVSAACNSSASGGPAATSAAPIAGGTATIRLGGAWTTFDIQGSKAEVSGNQIAYALYDRLVARAADGKILPYLAKSWTTTPSSATFTLRNDATCSDGASVSPTVVANSFKRLFDPKTASLNVTRQFGAGPFTITPNDGAGTIEFVSATPNSDLLIAFAQSSAMIVCPAGLLDPAALDTKAFGSGPYIIDSIVPGQTVNLKLRKDWKWGPNGATAAAAMPETLIFQVVQNTTTAANQELTGQIDVAQISGADVQRLEAEKALTKIESHGFAPFPLMFNEAADHPTSSDAVRKALMSVVDAKAWNQAAFDGRGLVSNGIVLSDVRCSYDASAFIPRATPQQALATLQSDGWAMSNGKLTKDGKPLAITLISTETHYRVAHAEYLQAQWNQLGVTTVIANTDLPTWLVNLRGGKFDAVVFAATGAVPQTSWPFVSVTGLLPPSGFNYGHIDDNALRDQILNGFASTGCDEWNTAQQMILQRHHFMPLSAPLYAWFSRGIDFTANGPVLEPWSLKRAR